MMLNDANEEPKKSGSFDIRNGFQFTGTEYFQ